MAVQCPKSSRALPAGARLPVPPQAPAAPAAAAAAPRKAAPAAAKPPPPAEPVPTPRVLTSEMRDAVGRRIVAEYPPSASLSRREFLTWCGLAWTAFSAASAAGLACCVRYMFPNVLFEPPMRFKAGPPSLYPAIGKVYEQFKAKWGVWLVRAEKEIYALSTICTHLGCTPNWLPAEQKFKCPCHGSGFYETGINFEGPAPRPLERYRIVLADDGQILVDKSVTYRFELGQWSNPDAYLRV